MSGWLLYERNNYRTRLELRGLVVLVWTNVWWVFRPFYTHIPAVTRLNLCGWHIFQLHPRFHIAVRSHPGAK